MNLNVAILMRIERGEILKICQNETTRDRIHSQAVQLERAIRSPTRPFQVTAVALWRNGDALRKTRMPVMLRKSSVMQIVEMMTISVASHLNRSVMRHTDDGADDHGYTATPFHTHKLSTQK